MYARIRGHGTGYESGQPTAAEQGASVVGQFYTRDSEVAGCVVVALYGELDLATAPALRARLVQLISLGRVRLVLDLDPLDFIDASGIGALTVVADLLHHRDGWLRLVGVRPHTRRVMRILGVSRQLPTYQTVDAAIAGPAHVPPR